MNKQILFSLLALIFLSSCNQHQDKSFYELKEIETVKLPLPNPKISHASNWDFFSENDRDYVLIYYYPYTQFVKYDLQTREIVKEFPFPDYFHYIFSFEYINSDSIWVMGDNSYSLAVDSQLVLINDKGKIQHIAPIQGERLISPEYSRALGYDYDTFKHAYDTLITPSTEGFVKDNNQNLIIGFNHLSLGTKENLEELPVIGVYNITKDTFSFNANFSRPKTDYFYHNSAYECKTNIKDNIFELSFTLSPTIWEWDLSKNTYSSYDLSSRYLDTIYHSSEPILEEKNDRSKLPGYLEPIHIEASGLTVRPVILSNQYGYSRTLIIADTNQNILDEFLCNKYLDSWNGRLGYSHVEGDSLEIDFYDIVKTKQNHHTSERLEAIKDSVALVYKNMECKISEGDVQKKNIQQYLNQHDIQDSSCSVVLVNVSGCPSCNEHTLNFLSVNKGALFNIKNQPLYFIYIDENTKQAKNRFQQLGLNESERIKIDTTEFYDTFYSGGEMNPRLILKKDNQIIHDSIYNPDVIGQLQLDLLNYYGFGYKKQEE